MAHTWRVHRHAVEHVFFPVGGEGLIALGTETRSESTVNLLENPRE